MNMDYLSIYLVLLFHLSELFGFPYINLVHNLLDLYLIFHFWGANVNDIVLNFKVHLLVPGI